MKSSYLPTILMVLVTLAGIGARATELQYDSGNKQSLQTTFDFNGLNSEGLSKAVLGAAQDILEKQMNCPIHLSLQDIPWYKFRQSNSLQLSTQNCPQVTGIQLSFRDFVKTLMLDVFAEKRTTVYFPTGYIEGELPSSVRPRLDTLLKRVDERVARTPGLKCKGGNSHFYVNEGYWNDSVTLTTVFACENVTALSVDRLDAQMISLTATLDNGRTVYVDVDIEDQTNH